MLSLIVFLPLVGVLLCALLPKRFELYAKYVALTVTLANFGLAAWMLVVHGRGEGILLEKSFTWIPQINVNYHIGLDGLSFPILVLSTLLFVLAVLASWRISEKPRLYFSMLCLLSLGLNGVFAALDLVLFYVFWEIVLVPMFFLISQWGGIRRRYAAMKFFLYTFLGSVVMLVGIVALYILTGSFNMIELQQLAPAAFGGDGSLWSVQWWIFLAFFLGIAVKIPIFPLHTWLPDAHVQAPTAASVLLAGVMLKMGTYAFLRVLVPLMPDAFQTWQLTLGILGVVSILYGAAVAFAQTDIKKLIAYSSISHMGFAMVGIAAGTATGFNAAMAVNISHGLTTSMLFFMVGMIYQRTKTLKISELSGIAAQMPRFAGFFCFAAFASMGLPLLSGFVGEFLAVLASWESPVLPPVITVLTGIGILCGGAYMLWLLQRSIFGSPSALVEGQKDLTLREVLVLAPLAVLVVVMGVYWYSILQFTDPFATNLARIFGA
ncbi:MAG: NADH-quinone oxidoreductase subunit M [Coriobacteriia bacterium]|nr:NADH-quinone oxidoreductase subunit M [Coriobacteriia bacterium]MCL2745956.1 NADH-quinone oxidoreductase subunit M [Coriobacteriia bacterium]MCL2870600.1 NADH-quinone oxidoreductase subunit M [Coriobacteriia bacterium]